LPPEHKISQLYSEMADSRGRKRNRETPSGGPQVVETRNVSFHSYSARINADSSLEWQKPHGWVKKVRDTDLLRIQCVRANLKLTHEYLINSRNNELAFDLHVKNKDRDGRWAAVRTKISLPPGNYNTRPNAEQGVTSAFLDAFTRALNKLAGAEEFKRYDTTFNSEFSNNAAGAVRARVAIAEGKTERFVYPLAGQTRHLTAEHRIPLDEMTDNGGRDSDFRFNNVSEYLFPNMLNTDGLVPIEWDDEIKNLRNGPTGRLCFLIDTVLAGTNLGRVQDLRVEFLSLADKPQSIQTWGARFNKDVAASFQNDDVSRIFTPPSIPAKTNEGALTISRSDDFSAGGIWTVLGISPNRFFMKPDHHYYLRLEDISNPNLETPFLTEGHSSNVIGQATPSSIIAQLNVGEKGDFANYEQRSDSGAAYSNGFFLIPAQHAVEKIKVKIIDEACSVILPEGRGQFSKGVIPFDLMLRFDVVRQPDNERSANTQVQSETTATEPHMFTIPGTIDDDETLKTQKIV